ncbi:VanZ family protein, partial [Streptococcus pneumoniae]
EKRNHPGSKLRQGFWMVLRLGVNNWGLRIVGTGFLISLLFECLQYILAIGITDITDLTLNTLGVCVGLLIYQIFIRVFKSQTRKWINILGMLSLGFAYLVLLLLHLIGV